VRGDRIGMRLLDTAWPDITDAKDAEVRPTRLEQTLVATFTSANQLRFAVDCLRSLSQIDLLGCRVWSPGATDDADLDALRLFLTDECANEIARALVEDHHVLVATVGDRSTGLAQAVLVDDARCAWTVVLPPRPSRW
jgi:hypothetical protein